MGGLADMPGVRRDDIVATFTETTAERGYAAVDAVARP
jgi:hypothetical protein